MSFAGARLKKDRGYLVALGLCLAIFTGCDKAKTDAISLVNQGVIALDRGEIDGASSHFANAASLDPSNASAQFHLGLIHAYYSQTPRKAERFFQEAARLEPRNPEILFQLGRIDSIYGDPLTAVNNLERCTSHDPNHAGAWHYKGNALWKLKNPTKAEAAWREAIAINPRRARSYLELGQLYEEFEHEEVARQVYQEGLRHNKLNPSLLNSLGVLELKMHENENAIVHLSEALKKDAGRLDTVFNLAFAYAEAGLVKKAVVHLRSYLHRANPETDKSSVRVATALKNALLIELSR